MIITIGGDIGAGKTVLAARLAKALGYEELYMGGIFREMAAEKAMTIERFYDALRTDPAAEREADDRQRQLMRERDNLVVQGRISWYFAKESHFRAWNILLKVDPVIGAQRSGQRPENAGRSAEEMIAATAERARHEQEHYRALYGIEDHRDPRHYDFILDTSDLSEEEVFKRTMEEIKKAAA